MPHRGRREQNNRTPAAGKDVPHQGAAPWVVELERVRTHIIYPLVGGQGILVGNLGSPTINPTPTQWPQARAYPRDYTVYLDFRPGGQLILALDWRSPRPAEAVPRQ